MTERDADLLDSFEINGPPRTKKTHNQAVVVNGKPRVFPSKEYRLYERAALKQLKGRRRARWPFSQKVHVVATFHLEVDSGDLCGFFQALGDVLQAAGVLVNDKQIKSWDRSRARVDGSPRTNVEIYPFVEGA